MQRIFHSLEYAKLIACCYQENHILFYMLVQIYFILNSTLNISIFFELMMGSKPIYYVFYFLIKFCNHPSVEMLPIPRQFQITNLFTYVDSWVCIISVSVAINESNLNLSIVLLCLVFSNLIFFEQRFVGLLI